MPGIQLQLLDRVEGRLPSAVLSTQRQSPQPCSHPLPQVSPISSLTSSSHPLCPRVTDFLFLEPTQLFPALGHLNFAVCSYLECFSTRPNLKAQPHTFHYLLERVTHYMGPHRWVMLTIFQPHHAFLLCV